MSEYTNTRRPPDAARVGPFRAEPVLRQAYDRFVVSDRSDEIAANLHRGFPADFMAQIWDSWGQPSFEQFLAWVHGLRRHDSVHDIAMVTGSFTTGLRVICHLAECNLVQVAADGTLAWHRDLKSSIETVAMAKVQQVLEDLLSPIKVGHFGQCAVNPGASVRRGLKVAGEVTYQDAEVVFLGDCDLASVVAAASLPGPVVAIDADRFTLHKLREAKRRLGLKKLDIVEHDLTSPLPNPLQHRFLSAVIDPIDSGWGIDLWLARVFEALRGAEGDQCYMSIDTQRIGPRLVALQEFMAHNGYAVTEIARNFHEWPLPIDSPDPHTAMVSRSAAAAGVSETALSVTSIYTDLIVFNRRIARRKLMPQDHLDIRRGI